MAIRELDHREEKIKSLHEHLEQNAAATGPDCARVVQAYGRTALVILALVIQSVENEPLLSKQGQHT